MSAEPETVAAPPPPAGPRRGWPALRPLLLRLHFYAGVFVAPFLLVAAFSGLLYAGSFQAERIVYAEQLRVPAGEAELPLTEQIAAARAAHPEGELNAVRPSPESGATTRVLLSGVDGVAADHTLAVFVDPYTGEVRGALEQYGSTGALPLRTWIDKFHRDLHLGETGRLYGELAASWLGVIAVAGLVLWFTRRRSARTVRGTTGRRRVLGVHGTVGAWCAVGLIFLSATGLTWSTYAGQNITELRTSLGQETPVVDAGAAGGGGEHAEHGQGQGQGDGGHQHDHGADGATPGGVNLDIVLAAARSQGLTNPVEILPPADAESAYVVRQIQRSWPEKQDAVAVDPATGAVTDVVRFADFPVLAKLSRWGIDLHTGVLFGLPNQILLAALALSVIVLIVWGYRMWWLRGRGTAFGRPLPRGAWRQVPPAIGVPLIAVTVLVGWFVPLLGISLLAFLVLDIALGTLRRHRAGRRATVSADPGRGPVRAVRGGLR
ncbi:MULTISPECIES: PepSY-associated TM helix domain-containing protein [unclassified Streptomyces]|uniref:PepSY-associated TM helix domain-containing protein n=1 Tax=unclassified Streptomyces TaxID=2593676 RepID=UPI0019085CF0|nr:MULTISPECIES: PepSY domain-containing protein [unclassified Streptomyces]MCU4748939.1 PepSY domain-containing protein [Streptomyces sp. G-5]QQN80376.1 PepSY domain-containing protein [Streptomyces sp. XC 2026]